MEVGESRKAAGRFYLEQDPLDPDLIPQLLRNILYIWPVRLVFSFLNSDTSPSEIAMMWAMRTTKELLEERSETPDEVYDSMALMEYERSIINLESLQPFYHPLLQVSQLLS